MIKHIVCVSDIHAGSAVGLCPESVRLDGAGVYMASENQLWLLDRWEELHSKVVPRWTGGEEYAYLVNGDGIEGLHHRFRTLISANMAVHARIAYELLAPIRERCAKMYLVRGTEAHDGSECEDMEQLAERLDAERCGPAFSWWTLDLELEGIVCNFAHHIGTTSSAAYESSALNREAVGALVEAGQWDGHYPHVIVRSHRHRYSRVGLPHSGGEIPVVVTPGWQLHTPFTTRIASMRRPQVGGICISVRDGEPDVRAKVWAPVSRAPENLNAPQPQRRSGKTSLRNSQRGSAKAVKGRRRRK